MLAPLLLFVQIFFTAVLRVAEKRFVADAAITDNMVQLQRKKGERREEGHFTHRQDQRAGGGGGGGGAEIVGMLYADDAGIVSRSSEKGWRGS